MEIWLTAWLIFCSGVAVGAIIVTAMWWAYEKGKKEK